MKRRWRHRVIKSISYLRSIVRGASRHQIEALEVISKSIAQLPEGTNGTAYYRNKYLEGLVRVGGKSELQTRVSTDRDDLLDTSIHGGFPTSFFEHDEITLTIDAIFYIDKHSNHTEI